MGKPEKTIAEEAIHQDLWELWREQHRLPKKEPLKVWWLGGLKVAWFEAEVEISFRDRWMAAVWGKRKKSTEPQDD